MHAKARQAVVLPALLMTAVVVVRLRLIPVRLFAFAVGQSLRRNPESERQ